MVSEGLRPHMSPSMPATLAALLEESWQLDPQKRPTAAQLVSKLRAACSEMSGPGDESSALQPLSERERQAARVAAAQHSRGPSAPVAAERDDSLPWPDSPEWVQRLSSPADFEQQVNLSFLSLAMVTE